MEGIPMLFLTKTLGNLRNHLVFVNLFQFVYTRLAGTV